MPPAWIGEQCVLDRLLLYGSKSIAEEPLNELREVFSGYRGDNWNHFFAGRFPDNGRWVESVLRLKG